MEWSSVLSSLAFLTLVVVSAVGSIIILVRRHRRDESDGPLVSDGGFAAWLPGQQTGFAHKPDGLTRWLTTVDHKDIGILYILFGIAAGLWGAVDGMMIRAEMFSPALTIWDANTYNAVLRCTALRCCSFL